MASALEELIGATVVDGNGQSVAVSSLAGADKVVGKWSNLLHVNALYVTMVLGIVQ